MIRFFQILFIISITSLNVYSQDSINLKSLDERTDKLMLIGFCDRTAFNDSAFSSWYDFEYNSYEPDSQAIIMLKESLHDYNIKIVLGTWCSDSRREVPRMLNVLDAVQYPDSLYTIVAVNRLKKGLSNEVDGLNIEFVPTFIVYKNNEEIGRIIETPITSLEKDLYNIISK